MAAGAGAGAAGRMPLLFFSRSTKKNPFIRWMHQNYIPRHIVVCVCVFFLLLFFIASNSPVIVSRNFSKSKRKKTKMRQIKLFIEWILKWLVTKFTHANARLFPLSNFNPVVVVSAHSFFLSSTYSIHFLHSISVFYFTN